MASMHLVQEHKSHADTTIDGLFSGALAGVLMAAYLVIAGLTLGEEFTVTLARFDPAGQSALVGLLIHLAVGGVYGVLFGFAWGLARRVRLTPPALLGGALFGITLFGLAEVIFLPASNSRLVAFPIWDLAAAHLLYGVALGWLMGRN